MLAGPTRKTTRSKRDRSQTSPNPQPLPAHLRGGNFGVAGGGASQPATSSGDDFLSDMFGGGSQPSNPAPVQQPTQPAKQESQPAAEADGGVDEFLSLFGDFVPKKEEKPKPKPKPKPVQANNDPWADFGGDTFGSRPSDPPPEPPKKAKTRSNRAQTVSSYRAPRAAAPTPSKPAPNAPRHKAVSGGPRRARAQTTTAQKPKTKSKTKVESFASSAPERS